MSTKRGRPKSTEPIKTKLVMVKMTPDEKKRIERSAKAEGLSVSAYLRREPAQVGQ